MQVGGYDIDIIVQGYPGKSVCHGGLGWSTIALLRGYGRVALIDVGSFGQRNIIVDQLKVRGLKLSDVTDVVLTHSHHDHAINWVMFDRARIVIGGDELDWAVKEPFTTPVPELYVRELNGSKRLQKVRHGETVLPGMQAYDAPGHTPGHLLFVLSGADYDVIFTGDSAKNRVELISHEVDMTFDAGVSRRSIERIWEFWQRRPKNIVVPGHDVPMVLENGRPKYIAERKAGIAAWFGETLDQTTLIELTVR